MHFNKDKISKKFYKFTNEQTKHQSNHRTIYQLKQLNDNVDLTK